MIIEDFKLPVANESEYKMMDIFKRIKSKPQSEWCINDFSDIASYSITNRTIRRLAEEGTITYCKRCPVKVKLRC